MTASKGSNGAGEGSLEALVKEAERRLEQATQAAAAAEERAIAEIRALEADLERERLSAAELGEKMVSEHEEELRKERDAKEEAISAAEARLAEIEEHAEAAERRVKAAERRAAEAEGAVAAGEARAREAAAAWLRAQVESIRREAARR